MSQTVRERALAYLQCHRVMTLATAGPQGPWAAALFYVSDGWDLYFLSAASTRHIRNLDFQSQVAATIQQQYEQWQDIRGIQLAGTVQAVSSGQQAHVVELYQQKFPILGDDAPDEITRAISRIAWWKLEPRQIYFIDNSRGLGHRDEVPLRAELPA